MSNKTKFRSATLEDKEAMLKTVGVEKIKSVVMRDIAFPDDPQGYECMYFPFNKQEFDTYLSEIDVYWTKDQDMMWEEIDDVIDYYSDEWEEYCETNKIEAYDEN